MKDENKKLGQEPAYPNDPQNTYYNGNGIIESDSYGMSKRFYAACAAMQGILASSGDLWIDADVVSTKYYEYADKLLKQESNG